MLSQKILKSASAPLLIIGLLLALLWGALFFKFPNGYGHATENQEKRFFPMALPTVLAPVIRKEVHKIYEDEPEKILFTFKLPSLIQILKVRQ